MLQRLAVAAAVLIALTGVAACGSRDTDHQPKSSSSQGAPTSNPADVTFASSMIPHHRQALEMVTLTTGRTLDPAVRTLADRIRAAQAPEIETMSRWLADWAKPVPGATATGHDSHDMGGMEMGSDEMPGMMSATEMASLQKASDAEFQDMWLRMMIRHHEGAITMAKAELADGSYGPAKDLAQQIIDGQQAEIDQMKQLLAS